MQEKLFFFSTISFSEHTVEGQLIAKTIVTFYIGLKKLLLFLFLPVCGAIVVAEIISHSCTRMATLQ